MRNLSRRTSSERFYWILKIADLGNTSINSSPAGAAIKLQRARLRGSSFGLSPAVINFHQVRASPAQASSRPPFTLHPPPLPLPSLPQDDVPVGARPSPEQNEPTVSLARIFAGVYAPSRPRERRHRALIIGSVRQCRRKTRASREPTESFSFPRASFPAACPPQPALFALLLPPAALV